MPDDTAILLSACIDYAFDPAEARHHQTRFVFEIDKGGFLPVDPRAGDLSPQQIITAVNPTIGDDAD
jgi:hypothetical protein